MEDLPIYSELSKIWSSISLNKVTIVNSATGSGKSIGIPLYFLKLVDEYYFQYSKLFVSVPTILNVKNLYTYTNSLRDNEDIGYITGYDRSEYINTNKVIYGVTRSIINHIIKLYKYHKLYNIIIMIDECHCTSRENYYLMLLCNFLLERNIKIKVIISTATPISIDIFPRLKTSDVYNIDTRKYKVDTIWGDYDDSPDKMCIDSKYFIKAYDKMLINDKDGGIIIFVDGSKSCYEIKYDLMKHRDKFKDCEIHLLYSNMEEKYKEAIHMNTNKKKIIICTDVIENGVTINGISHIFDYLLHKKKYDISLISQIISKQSSIQRKGRVGRVSKGFYYPVCTENFYNHYLDEFGENYFLSTDNIDLTVELLNYRLDPQDILKLEKYEYDYQINYLKKCMIIDDNLKIIDMELLKIKFRMFKNNILLSSCLKTLNIMISPDSDKYDYYKYFILLSINALDNRLGMADILYYNSYNLRKSIDNDFISTYNYDSDIKIYMKITLDILSDKLNMNIPFNNTFIKNIKTSIKNISKIYDINIINNKPLINKLYSILDDPILNNIICKTLCSVHVEDIYIYYPNIESYSTYYKNEDEETPIFYYSNSLFKEFEKKIYTVCLSKLKLKSTDSDIDVVLGIIPLEASHISTLYIKNNPDLITKLKKNT